MKPVHHLLKYLLCATLLFCFSSLRAQHVSHPPITDTTWAKDYPPFRIAGNLYYVGTYDLSSYLITTPQGHILINTGLDSSAYLTRRHVESLGFKFSDIKILIASHAHFDHVGAMAIIKEMTGAKMMIHEKDVSILADGGSTDYALGGFGPMFNPVKADKQLHDKDIVKLGDMEITVLHHPGHTKGSCSFLFDVKDQDRTYRVLIANMPSILSQAKFPTMPAYPNIGKDYGYTFDAMKKLKFDIFLAAHASQFHLHKKHQPGDVYRPAAFFDRPGYDSSINALEKVYLKKMGKE